MTWVKEDGTLLGSSRGILDHREACRSSRAVMVIHQNIEGSALQVGVRGIDPKALTAPPRNLQDIQEGWRGDGTKWNSQLHRFAVWARVQRSHVL
jgi:hypothetical protein